MSPDPNGHDIVEYDLEFKNKNGTHQWRSIMSHNELQMNSKIKSKTNVFITLALQQTFLQSILKHQNHQHQNPQHQNHHNTSTNNQTTETTETINISNVSQVIQFKIKTNKRTIN